MNLKQYRALAVRNTDIQGAVKRLYDSEEMYEQCLRMFLKDSSVEELNAAIKGERWDDAFTAAHALKGVAGNMGFIPLMQSVAQIIVLLRVGRLTELDESLNKVNSSYRDITEGIDQYFAVESDTIKETIQ